MQRHFCGLVDASVVRDTLLRRGRTRLLRPLQQIKLCATIFYVISNYVTALWVCVPSTAAVTTIRDYVFKNFYCHTIGLMSTTHYEILSQIETRFPPCVKLF